MSIKNIDCKTLKKWIEKNEAIVVDVREEKEHQAKKIKGSILLPLGNICQDSLKKFKDRKIVLHCQSGKRSQMACQKLVAEDDNLSIYNLEGGISAWSAEGNETLSSGKFFLPIDRQVQTIIGSLTLFGSLLGYFVNPSFFFLPAFFGLGLTFAGLSGYCGLAMLLTKMPWNRS